ncbi:hypothetical protein TRFO_37639 [Tritrichomonas foetus]|uniref:Uncharacterized protein n=1 Tax=Tritrichomonas foetus TaxID=1144522 RepID=A0A1J4JF07_9EUKA|nr:hypothetical protein TRFO_37639 [Tritrichomonas foetus]|eukprot:OHS96227.1 hypothetical protein TRFO_37639 [Tritrichomonas foetus]
MSASENFKNILNILINKEDINRTNYIYCMASLSTIKKDLPYIFNYISQNLDQGNWEKYLSVFLDVIASKPAGSFHFTFSESLDLIKYLLSINKHLNSLEAYIKYMRALKIIISSFPPGSDPNHLINLIRGVQTINAQVGLAAVAYFIPQIANEALQIIIPNLNMPVSLFSLTNVLKVIKTITNVPLEFQNDLNLDKFFSVLNLFAKNSDNKSNDDKNSNNHDSNDDVCHRCNYQEFLVYFVANLQEFYDIYNTLVMDQQYFNLILNGIQQSELQRSLVAQMMSTMPSSNFNQNLQIGNQLSALLVTISVYIDDYESTFTKNIVKFAYERKTDQMFIDTLVMMPNDPKRYTTAVFIGAETNLFSNSSFFKSCFPQNPKEDLFIPISNAVKFLISRNLIHQNNVKIILTSLFSMFSNPLISTNKNYLQASADALKSLDQFMDIICLFTYQNIDKIVSFTFLIGIINMILSHQTFVQSFNPSSVLINDFLRCLAVVAHLIESKRKTTQEKISLIRFLSFLKGEDIRVFQPTSLTIIDVVSKYISESTVAMFCAIVLDLFTKDTTYSVVLAALPKLSEEHLNEAMARVDNFSIKNQEDENAIRKQFVLFYKTRICVDPLNTIDHLFKLIEAAKKNNSILFFKRPPPPGFTRAILRLLTIICRNESLTCKLPRIGELVEFALPLEEKALFFVQNQAKKVINEASKNKFIVLNTKFLKNLIGISLFSESIPYLLTKLPRKDDDAIVAAKAWTNHLVSHNESRFHNQDIALAIIRFAEDSSPIPQIISAILPEVAECGLPCVDFAACLVDPPFRKSLKYFSDDPMVVLTFSKFCLSKNEEERIAAYKFVFHFFGLPESFSENDILSHYEKKHPKNDRISLFLSLFLNVFQLHKKYGTSVFQKITKESVIQKHHALLTRAIVDANCEISESVLYDFTKKSFKSPNICFEAQKTLKSVAIQNMDLFVKFLLSNNLNEFSTNVVRRITYSTDLRTKLIAKFIEILQKSVASNSRQGKLLEFIVISDISGELSTICCGNLLLIIVMILGLSFGSQKKLPKLQPSFELITKRKMTFKFETDNIISFDKTLEYFSHVLMKIPVTQLNEFCRGCFESVKAGNEYVIIAIGILFIHLSKAYSDFGSITAERLKTSLWDTVSKSLNRSGMKTRRYFAYVLNRVLTIPNIDAISNISKNHIFNTILESLTGELDDFKSDAIDIVCIFLPYLKAGGDITLAFDPEKLVACLQRSLKRTEINARILTALNILVDQKISFFGERKGTKLNVVEIATKIVKGTQTEQHLCYEMFKKMFQVDSDEEVVKMFYIRFSDDDFQELCYRLVNQAKPDEIDENWMQVLIWIGESMKNKREIVPDYKPKMFNLLLQIFSNEKHSCSALAMKWMKEFM